MRDRRFKILEIIVDEYIKTGEPVGSKALTGNSFLNVSAATIRNEMAVLEKQGFLEQPHTSAGRIPTFQGYRFYIDNLMKPTPLTQDEISEIEEMLMQPGSISDETIVHNATKALSDITKCAALVKDSSPQFSVISKVEVIPTGRRIYVLLLVTSSGSVKNKSCRLEFDLTDEQIAFFTNFINSHLQGISVSELSPAVIQSLAVSLGSYVLALSPLLYAVYELSEELFGSSVSVEGQSQLLSYKDVNTREVIRFLETRKELTTLLDETFNGVNVLFGRENDTFVVSNSSIIVSGYKKDELNVGSLGILGPLRLDYKKIIPYIEYFTKKITAMLSENNDRTVKNESEETDIE